MNDFKFSEKQIRKWGGDKLFDDADANFCKAGRVLRASFEAPFGEADIKIHNGGVLRTKFEVAKSGAFIADNQCPCAVSQQYGQICVHNIAAAITLMRRAEGRDRSAERAAETARARTVQQAEAEGLLPHRVPNGMPFKLRFRVNANWEKEYDADSISLDCNVVLDGAAKPIPIQSAVRQRTPLLWREPSQAGFDDFALGLLEELCADLSHEIKLKHY
ncbi:MAG: hypothetical protein FWG05_04125, partial [Kiritimatiellaeota bacterium]|nr:hypothetical protein [Kiritimatiellota bacterium]